MSGNSEPHPFTKTLGADIILRSCDGIDFHVHKGLLAFASPFFQDLFSLPPNDEQTNVIPMAERGKVLETLLSICYPMDKPTPSDLDELVDVLEAAMKYDITLATKILRKEFQTYISTRSLDVYAAACRLRMDEEAKAAAEVWRRYCEEPVPLLVDFDWARDSLAGQTYSKAMDKISAGALFRLLQYAKSQNAVEPFSFIDPPPVPSGASDSIVPHPVLEPFPEYEDADLILKSSDDVEFRVHKTIIYLASANKLKDAVARRGLTLPTIVLQEHSEVLQRLLQLCYPTDDYTIDELSMIDRLLSAALRYKMLKVVRWLEMRLLGWVRTDPLRVYYIASRFGLREEALEGAKRVAERSLQDDYVSEMETVPAITYYRLLHFAHRYYTIVKDICGEYQSVPCTGVRSVTKEKRFHDTVPPLMIAAPLMQREVRVPDQGYIIYPHKSYQDMYTKLADESMKMYHDIETEIQKIDLLNYEYKPPTQ